VAVERGEAPASSDEQFARFVVRYAALAAGLAYLITDDQRLAHQISTEAWPDVYRRWRRIESTDHFLSSALGPFVARAVTRARDTGPPPSGGLELRDHVTVDGGTVISRPEPDDALGDGFRDLSPRDRALVALHSYVGISGRGLVRALGWKTPRAAYLARRVGRDLMLTVAPYAASDDASGAVDHAAAFEERLGAALATRAAAAQVDGEATLAQVRPLLDKTRQLRPRNRVQRRWVVATGVAAAVAAATTIGVVSVVGGPHRSDVARDPTRQAAHLERVQAPPGKQVVGYGSVFTTVPSSWTHNGVLCGKAVENTVIYPDATAGCDPDQPLVLDVPASSVTFNAPPTNALVLGRLREVNDVGGDAVYASTPRQRGGLLEQMVIVPRADVQMVVRTPDPHVLDDIVDSMQVVPTGFTVVPPCERLPLRDAVGLLAAAGLRVQLTQASTLSEREATPPVTHQTIASGRLVPAGTVVGLGFPSMN
jgi:hypothetical protein